MQQQTAPAPVVQKKFYPSLGVTDAAVLSEALDSHLKELSPLCTSLIAALREKALWSPWSPVYSPGGDSQLSHLRRWLEQVVGPCSRPTKR